MATYLTDLWLFLFTGCSFTFERGYSLQKEKRDIVSLLEQGETVQIQPKGTSMYPMFISGRDWAVLKKAYPDACRKGDVILYRSEQGILVLHRIYKINNEEFYTVGDNLCTIEGPICDSQVIGILIGFIRRNRYVSSDNLFYVFISRLWMMLFPVRSKIMRIYRRFRFSNDCD